MAGMKLWQKQALFAYNIADLIKYINEIGYSCTLGEAERTQEQAVIYVAEGKGIEDSLHCKRLAIDLNIFDKDGKYLTDTPSYERFGVYWEKLNAHNRWGGRFKRKDGNHFEMTE